MDQQNAADKSRDGSSHQSRRSSRSEKSSDKVQPRDGGKERLPPNLVRGGPRGPGESKTSDTDVEVNQVKTKKKSLQDYPLTAKSVEMLEKLNMKEPGVPPSPASTPRAAPAATATSRSAVHGISPSPARSSPSPPRQRDDFSMDSRDKFGFFDFGPMDPHSSRRNTQYESNNSPHVSTEQQARAALNRQAEFLMERGVAEGQQHRQAEFLMRQATDGQHQRQAEFLMRQAADAQQQRVSSGDDRRAYHDGRGHAPWPGQLGHLPTSFPDLSGIKTGEIMSVNFINLCV